MRPTQAVGRCGSGFLVLWLLPRPVLASELDHVMQGVVPLLWLVLLAVVAVVGVGFASRFLVWPSFATLTGKVAAAVLAVVLAMAVFILKVVLY